MGLSNQIRGLLSNYGIAIKLGIHSLRKALPEIVEDENNELSIEMRHQFRLLYEELCHLTEKVKSYDKTLSMIHKDSELSLKYDTVPGVGVIVATAILSIGDLNFFKNGRHFAAFLGLVPKECSSGDKRRLSGITKRGNTYVRSLLVHGARSVVQTSASKDDPLSLWCKRLRAKSGMNKASVALANKLARIIWRMATTEESFNLGKTCAFVDNTSCCPQATQVQ